MKKIINGKKYDTETATKIGYTDSCHHYNDFHYWEEALYQKKTGEFFLYGEGGPASKYAERCPDGLCGSKQIIPFTEKEAQEWAEKYLDVDKYESIFGPVEE